VDVYVGCFAEAAEAAEAGSLATSAIANGIEIFVWVCRSRESALRAATVFGYGYDCAITGCITLSYVSGMDQDIITMRIYLLVPSVDVCLFVLLEI
jgi:hypothetical protein